jgi:hypothetical protein
MLYIVDGNLRVKYIPTRHWHTPQSLQKKTHEHGTNLNNYTLKISLDKGIENYIQNQIMVIANYKLKFLKTIATSKAT